MSLKDKSKKDVKESEDLFQEYQKHYFDFKDKESSDKCFSLIYDCIKNIALKKARGKIIPDLDETVLDASLDVFEKFKDGTEIKKLSSFCYYPLIQRLYNKNKQFVDREISLEAWLQFEYSEND